MSDQQKPLRLSQLRMSRVDHGKKSSIPRFTIQGNSVDRVSGVQLLDSIHASASRSISRPTSIGNRHRSAESNRHTISNNKPRPLSAQRSNLQHRPHSMYSNAETPLSKGFHSKDSLITPMSTMSVNNHRVSRARTPSSERTRTQRYIIEKLISAPPIKDRRPVSDTAWQRSTESYIVSRLREDKDFQTNLPTSAAPLRPITIRLFLDITNHLLIKCAGTRFEVNANNYVIKLPNIAQKLLYPGVMSKSWLKSVNAMHSYPNVLAFLSYLIVFADNQENIKQSVDYVTLYGDDKNGKIRTLRHKYYFETWRLFQDGQDFSAITDKYIDDLKNLNNLSEEVYENSLKRLIELKMKKKEIVASVDKLKQLEKTLDAESTTLKGRASHLREIKMELSHDLSVAKNNLDIEKNKMNNIVAHIKELEYKIQDLKDQFAKQKMTPDERENILKEVDLLNEAADGNQDILSDMEKLIFEKEIEFAAEQKKVLMTSFSVNKLLMTVSSSLGQDLNSYGLQQRELLSDKTPQNIKNTCDILKKILAETENKLHSMQNQKKCEVSHLQQIKSETNQLKERTTILGEKMSDMEKRIELKKSEILAAKRDKETLSVQRNQLQEKKKEQENILQEANKKLTYWKEQDSWWQQNLSKLRSEESMIREQCKERADAVISECFCIVDELQPFFKNLNDE